MTTQPKTGGAQEILDRNAWALSWLATALGVVIVFSPPQRWSSPVWHDALKVPHAPTTFGIVILAGGILLLLGTWRRHRVVQRVGCGLAWAWCVLVAVLQISSYLHDPTATANPIGMVIWLYASYIYALRFRGFGKLFYA